jgi:hypothetical protein
MAWLSTEVSAILGRMIGVPLPVIRRDIPHHPEIWTDICGWYSFRGSLRDAQKWFVGGAQVFVRRGQLTLRPLTPVPALAADCYSTRTTRGSLCLRIDLSSLGMAASRVVFTQSSADRVTAFHLDLDAAPLSFDKRSVARP